MNYVLDASAILAYLRGEAGGTVVHALLRDTNSNCYAHSITICEVYYQALRILNVKSANAVIAALYKDGVIERRDISRRFWQRVGEHKSRGRISLPDCFCISLAQELNAEAVTSDHAEFDPLVPIGIVPIKFIR